MSTETHTYKPGDTLTLKVKPAMFNGTNTGLITCIAMIRASWNVWIEDLGSLREWLFPFSPR